MKNNTPRISQRLSVVAIIIMIIAVFVGCASNDDTKALQENEIPNGEYKILDVRESAYGHGFYKQCVSIVLVNEEGTRYVYTIRIIDENRDPVTLVPGDNVIVTSNDIALLEDDFKE